MTEEPETSSRRKRSSRSSKWSTACRSSQGQTRVLEPALPAPLPARQAAALAATGFAAGAVTVAVVSRRRATRPARRRKRKKGAIGEIVSSNSFLVDVHLLKRD